MCFRCFTIIFLKRRRQSHECAYGWTRETTLEQILAILL